MGKKFILTALLAFSLVGAAFFAFGASGAVPAEAACPPGDTGCNQANSLAADITRANNASTIFFFGGPVFFQAPIVTVPVVAPVVTFPVVAPVFVQSPFLFGFPFGGCGFVVSPGFCPSSYFWSNVAFAWGFPPFFP